MRYEYKVVPAPAKGEKARGVKTGEARFALALEHLMNSMGTEGWEYQRAETLPSEERAGLTSSVTVWRNVLVFRRALEVVALLESPERVTAGAGLGAAGIAMRGADDAGAGAVDGQVDADVAEDGGDDNGVEETQDVDRPLGVLQARAARLETGQS